ncbi:alpha/beta fold hydrolase [Pseudodesulfovibrio tunisiensis]|uniref:alpha/beta fold hydrolase n=1 Tax=Pseudodesulfovibrio tunisiensis TaxID=463192 RepID=UPI001FB47729|nr:alpha/beta hydrolase [Pseudodesulfovibrio tunisiensis]
MRKRVAAMVLLLVCAGVAVQGEAVFSMVLRAYFGLHGIHGKRIVRGGDTVFLFEGGPRDGRTVLLLHGVGGNALTSWFRLMPDLARQYRVIAPDMFFANLPDLVGSGYGIDLENRLVDMLFDNLDVERASIVGLSFGAWPALRAAADHPERVDRVVLVSPLGGKADQVLEGLDLDPDDPGRDFHYRIFSSPPPVPSLFLRPHWDRTTRVFRALPHFLDQLAVEGERLEAAMPRVQCPVLIVCGEQDRIMGRELFRDMAGQLPHGSLLELEGSGHAVVWDRADALAGVVTDFLGQEADGHAQ